MHKAQSPFPGIVLKVRTTNQHTLVIQVGVFNVHFSEIFG